MNEQTTQAFLTLLKLGLCIQQPDNVSDLLTLPIRQWEDLMALAERQGVLAEKVMQSTLYDDDYLFNSGKSDWTVRWLLVKNMLTRDKWKYRDIA